MAPKNKGKKGKKQDDDEFWCVPAHLLLLDSSSYALESRETAGTSIAGNNVEAPANAGEASDDDFKPKGKGKASAFSAFAALGMEEPPVDEDGDEDFGGLMVRKMPLLVLRKLLI